MHLGGVETFGLWMVSDLQPDFELLKQFEAKLEPSRIRSGDRRLCEANPRSTSTPPRPPDRGWNNRQHPFVWTKTADEILKKANRQNTSNTDR